MANAADFVVHDVVVGDATDGIGARLSTHVDGHYHLLAVQFGFLHGGERRVVHGMKHHGLEDVDAGQSGEETD